MNHFQAITARLESDWPDYQMWYVPKAVGGTTWCARRWDETGDVIHRARAWMCVIGWAAGPGGPGGLQRRGTLQLPRTPTRLGPGSSGRQQDRQPPS
jgi:hypothetical protein